MSDTHTHTHTHTLLLIKGSEGEFRATWDVSEVKAVKRTSVQELLHQRLQPTTGFSFKSRWTCGGRAPRSRIGIGVGTPEEEASGECASQLNRRGDSC